jgi:phenylalanyl-tRNA synthetase beta chain
LRYAKSEDVLCAQVPEKEIREILQRLSFSVVRKFKKNITVNIPGFRPDISREADLIEEVARLYGYDKIPVRLSRLTPNFSYVGNLELDSDTTYNMIRRILSSLGLREIMTYSLISRQALRKLEFSADEAITVTNPLSYTQEILRPTLLAGMLNVLLSNINRKNTNLKLFELSRIYLKTDAKSTEEMTNLSIALSGKKEENWLEKSAQFSFFDLKGIVEQLLNKLGVKDLRFAEEEFPSFIRGRSACVFLGKDKLGFLGEIKKEILERFDIPSSVYACEFRVHKLIGHTGRKRFVPLARFPSIERDISLIAPQEIQSKQIFSLINKIGGDLIAKVSLFDQYFGEQIPQGFRGLSFSIKYHSKDRTLTAEEVDALHRQIRQALVEELGVQIR